MASIVVRRVSLSVGSPVARVDSRTQRTQRFILVQAIRAYVQQFDDPCIQEHPNRGLQQSVRDIWQGIARC
jgi:hypothetical protein